MFQNATVSSRSSSSRSGGTTTCGRNSSMPSLPSLRLHQGPPLMVASTSFNPVFRHSDALTSFDASQFVFTDQQHHQKRSDRRQNGHRRHALLRRFNSHDSHTTTTNVNFLNSSNFVSNFNDSSIVSIEDEPGKLNEFESVGYKRRDMETSPENTGDRDLNNKKRQEYNAKDFLERFSLPRVVRVENGEPLLLYRCIDSFTKVQATGFIGKKRKEKMNGNQLFFPEGYCGWFSLTNEKGEKSAIAHSSILQLVREQVCSFLSLQPFTAYAGHNPDPGAEIPGKVQYLKTQVKGGQLFQLRAVFQHKEHLDNGRHSTKSSHVSRSARDKDLANRYAQIISQNNQEFYVPLTTKGEFYETHSSMKARLCFQGLLEKTGPLALDKDCLYKITHLLRRIALPVKVKLLSGPLPPGLPKDFSDTFILEKKIQEPLMVTCTLPSSSDSTQHNISCINLNSGVKLTRSMLGFESENRLFKSQRLQTALAYCHKNVETWYREVRIAPNLQPLSSNNINSIIGNLPQTSSSSSSSRSQQQKLANLEIEDGQESINKKQLITKEVIEKFPKSKKWYKHLVKLGIKSDNPLDKYTEIDEINGLDGMEKIKSIERYKDMSRLIEERFGKRSYNPVKKSASFMFSTKPINLEENSTESKSSPTLLKCQSLDAQIYTIDEPKKQPPPKPERRHSKSNVSDNVSFDFQMCILENDNSLQHDKLIKKEDLNEIKIVENSDNIKPLKKSKPDLIPTLPKNDDNSYITDRLCSEFHVKTKVQKRIITKPNEIKQELTRSNHNTNVKSVVVQVHNEISKTKMLKKLKGPEIDDIPYSQVADEIREDRSGEKKIPDENIYAEICENSNDTCDRKQICQCKRTKKNCTNKSSEYCYVKLGSNGDSVTQSDSDEAIYNTLR
nr:uncharacterized protein LOC111424471 [Onthophagus taurus]XP_022913777.1 uncharacterized protein LOC111424471 [Onthophagus taurus]